ncbi:MAG: hypothetical protein IPH09_08365, partial [bacterium]|nr:hypothetical protein [bacterium]
MTKELRASLRRRGAPGVGDDPRLTALAALSLASLAFIGCGDDDEKNVV